MRRVVLRRPPGTSTLGWLAERQQEPASMFPRWPAPAEQLALVAVIGDEGQPLQLWRLESEVEAFDFTPEHWRSALYFLVPAEDILSFEVGDTP